MKIYDRAAKAYREEKQYGGKSLEFLYHTVVGRILLKAFVCRRVYSKLNGIWMRSSFSVRRIKPFVREYGVNLSACEKTDFKSFDDFFTRKYRWSCSAGAQELIAPCWGRLAAYGIDKGLILRIKDSVYTLPELVDNRLELSQYEGGVCLVYRLALEDCHRYYFCDDGRVLHMGEIAGVLHTVRPISKEYRVFSKNHRVYTLMRTAHFGDMVQIEVGALQIGKINNHELTTFARMEEKGYFSYGGSTIIQLFLPGVISVDEDIRKHSNQGVEVLVSAGEKIAERQER